MTVICSSCGAIKEDFKELAKHISASKKGHQKGKVWSAKFLLDVRRLNNKKDWPKDRTALTDTEKENKRNSKTTISGVEEKVTTTCPSCGAITMQSLPVEYTEELCAWKSKNGAIFVNCENCRR